MSFLILRSQRIRSGILGSRSDRYDVDSILFVMNDENPTHSALLVRVSHHIRGRSEGCLEATPDNHFSAVHFPSVGDDIRCYLQDHTGDDAGRTFYLIHYCDVHR